MHQIMDDDQREVILRWVKDIELARRPTPPPCAQNTPPNQPMTDARIVPMTTTPPRSSWEGLNSQKRTLEEMSSASVADPPKRPRFQRDSDSHSSVLRLRDDITLTGSTSTSTSASRQRSLSPSRAKANLARASPSIVYINELGDPGNEAAKQLLARLLVENGECTSSSWIPPEESIAKISAASYQCTTEIRSEGSWVIKVACPLLELAIEDLPLECWSV